MDIGILNLLQPYRKLLVFAAFWVLSYLSLILLARRRKYTVSGGDRLCWAISTFTLIAILMWFKVLLDWASRLKLYLVSVPALFVVFWILQFIFPDIFAEHFRNFIALIVRWLRCMVAPFSARAERTVNRWIDRLEDSVKILKIYKKIRDEVKNVIDTRFEGVWKEAGYNEDSFIKLTNYLRRKLKGLKPDFSKVGGGSAEQVKIDRWKVIKSGIERWLNESIKEFRGKAECEEFIEHLKSGSEELGLKPLWREVLSRLETEGFVKELTEATPKPQFVSPDLRGVPRPPMVIKKLRDTDEPFVGRKDELERAKSLLAQVKSFAIVGPMGIGKSRLLRRAAEELVRENRYPFDTYAVVSITKDMDIKRAIDIAVAQLASQSAAGGAADPYQRLVDAMADRRALIIFENGELLPEDISFHRLIEAVRSVGSAFILTTRHLKQAELSFPQKDHIKLEPLSEDETITLMKEHIEQHNISKISDEQLRRINDKIVRGFPVFAKVAAGAINDYLQLEPKFDIEAFMGEFRNYLPEEKVSTPDRERTLTLEALLRMSYSKLKRIERKGFRVMSMLPSWTDELFAAAVEIETADTRGIVKRLIDLALIEKGRRGSLCLRIQADGRNTRFSSGSCIPESAR